MARTADPKKRALPKPQRLRLKNGLRVVVVPLPHLHTVAAGVFARAGSRYESPKTNGLSHFLEHMLFRGTADHPSPYAFNLALESLGGSLRAATHVDFTVYDVAVPPENLTASLALLAAPFHSPMFKDIETEKRIVAEEILSDLDESGREVDIENLSRRLLFGKNPLAFKITGHASRVKTFTRAHLRTHLKRHYGAENLVLCLAGPVSLTKARAAAERTFGRIPRGKRVPVPAVPKVSARAARFLAADRRSSQADVRICFRTFGQRDPRITALHVLGRVLDDGLSSRLYRRICEDSGLAYDAFGSAEVYEDTGVFDFGATVSHEKSGLVVEEFFQMLREIKNGDVTAQELEKAKTRHGYSLTTTLDQAESMMSFYGVETLFGIEDSLAEIQDRVRRVTLKDLVTVAREVFDPRGAHCVTVGDPKSRRLAERAFRTAVAKG
jgi:predicted Zn-dependent peptidase